MYDECIDCKLIINVNNHWANENANTTCVVD